MHGGGWRVGDRRQANHAKPAWANARGMHYASIGYRLLPDAPVEEQARDVAAAIRHLRSVAAQHGYDPDRIVLSGHSAGAHLAALVATDPAYLGDDMMAIAGVLLIDGAGYDVAAHMASRGIELPGVFRSAFGSDPARQAALSPISHAGAPNASDWLILHDAAREPSTGQSRILGAALRDAGARVEVAGIADTTHRRLNTELGTKRDGATPLVDDWLDALLAR